MVMGYDVSTRSLRHRARQAAAGFLIASAALGAAAQGLTLNTQDTPNVWRPTSAANAFAGLSLARERDRGGAGSLHLFGDYYFYDPAQGGMPPALAGVLGGFRASSGVTGLATPMSLFDNLPESSQNLPYVGVGYSHLWLNNTLSLNADLGLATPSGWGNPRLHGLANGTPTLDDVTRDLRWAPVMSLNLRFSF